MKYIIRILFILGFFVFSGCDGMGPLSFRNGLDSVISVELTLSNGRVATMSVEPKMEVGFSYSIEELDHISIFSKGTRIFLLGRGDVVRMIGSVSNPYNYVWNIQQDEIKPLKYSDLKAL